MNFRLLHPHEGQWLYDSPDQERVAQCTQELLGWDLRAFDRWIYDSSHWTMYTRERQRLIALRDDLVVCSTRHFAAEEPIHRCLILHCIQCWRLVRSSKTIPHPLLVALTQACTHAQALAARHNIPVKLRMRSPQTKDKGEQSGRSARRYGAPSQPASTW